MRTNTLLSVGALVRFPAILKITVETPAHFQEAIRQDYPVYSLVDANLVPLPDNLPADVQVAVRAAIQNQMGIASPKAHRFVSADGHWTVQLSQDYLVLGCNSYPKWETFQTKLASAFNLLVQEYKPAYASGTSLRYQNGIIRSTVALANAPWSRLLGPLTLGVFSDQSITDDEVTICANQFELKAPDDVKVRVRHGLAKVLKTNEPVYTIDNEFSSEQKVELNHVLAKFDQFHSLSGSLYRQCISDELFKLLGPVGSQ